MKKRVMTIVMLLTLITTVLSGCGEKAKEIDMQKVKEDIISECSLEDMRDATADEISFLYDFGDVEYDEIVLSISQQAVSADQITIVKAKSKDDTKEIKKVIDEQLESKKSTFEDYAPEEEAKYDDCEVKINGVYVYVAVCSDNAKAESIFDEAFEN